ncbi:DoxX family protein [Ruania alba]|uniref:Putative oxidoreductase n=1 Tax=Ruania alba TaxID=648782 RepID=A0A1H5HD42_9MICO|nr:DoxX family protein [Ruania alba]SEE25899.1 putative oxidoreductase [Ruania alba]
MNLSARHPIVADLALAVTRIVIGIIFVAHGWQKVSTFGIAGTAEGFTQMGVPLPTASAWFTAIVELGGGAALILGILTPIAGALLLLNMVGALVLVHAGAGIFVTDGGWELVAALGSAALALTALGAGRFSLDSAIFARRRRE